MKKLKGNYGLYVSLGLLVLAIAGSAFFYKKEADKAKQIKAEVTRTRDRLNAIRISEIPTDTHRQHLEQQKTDVEGNYQQIIRQALRWNFDPAPMSGLEFQGYMGNSVDMILAAARDEAILVEDKARYLGFEEYAVAPPSPDEDVVQLQREFSAAMDIARLLIASKVYSIDRMARRDEARMEAGTPSTVRDRLLMDGEPTSRRSSKNDFYDTVPFRVQFTCTYPSLAFFMKSLITPRKIGKTDPLPKNFLVINDMRFKVKELEEESDKVGRGITERIAPIPYTAVGRRTTLRLEDIPLDLPGADAMIDRLGEARALAVFRQWRAMSETEKEIYRLQRKLAETTISPDERLRVSAKLERMRQELADRQTLKGRPPEYSTLEVTMLIDYVQFTDKLVAELKEDSPDTKGSASSLTTARR
jgi:hypothetical protein